MPTRYLLSIHFVIENAGKWLSSTCEKATKKSEDYTQPHANLQTMNKTPVKFRKNRYKTVGGVAPTRYPLSIHFVIDNAGKMAEVNL